VKTAEANFHSKCRPWADGRIFPGEVIGRRLWAGIVAILVSTTLAGEAKGEDKEFFVLSTGVTSCGEFLRAIEEERKARPVHPAAQSLYSMNYLSFMSYADGYLSGANWAASESLAGQHSDWAGRMAWLENYCRRNPLDNYIAALIKLRGYLVEHRQ
jgi:hypothetical protein